MLGGTGVEGILIGGFGVTGLRLLKRKLLSTVSINTEIKYPAIKYTAIATSAGISTTLVTPIEGVGKIPAKGDIRESVTPYNHCTNGAIVLAPKNLSTKRVPISAANNQPINSIILAPALMFLLYNLYVQLQELLQCTCKTLNYA